MRMCIVVVLLSLALAGCRSPEKAPKNDSANKVETNEQAASSDTSTAEAKPIDPNDDEEPTEPGAGSQYPIVVTVDDFDADKKAEFVARLENATQHSDDLDAKCVEFMGDQVPIASDSKGQPAKFGCTRPAGDPKTWGVH